MNEIINFHISGYRLFEAFVLGSLLFLILKMLRKALNLLLHSTAHRRWIVRIFPAAGAFAWIAFAYWALNAILTNPVHASLAWLAVLLTVFACFSWFALKDYFAGLILRIHDNYEEGQRFKVGDVEGTIRRLRLLDVEIERENGEKIQIPYNRISGEIHWKNPAYKSPNYHKFIIGIKRNASIDTILDRLRLCIFNSPWAATNKEPQIRILSQTENAVDCEVCVYALNGNYFHILEREVRKQMSC